MARRHGTHSGWAAHQRAGERPCDPCWQAKREYDQRRLASSDAKRQNRLRAKAQNRARTILTQRYFDEYRELYVAALEEVYREEEMSIATPSNRD